MQTKEIETFCPTSKADWREWLKKNHESKQSVWLVYHKKNSGVSSIAWSEAVDVALCFGWVDSRRKSVDNEKFIQFFSQRKTNTTWSKINKEKVQRLIDEGLMEKAGHSSIAIAKQNGSWAILDKVEELKIPKDLNAAFKMKPGAKKLFLGLSKSVRKAMLQWIVLAKRRETRQKRITEVVELAAQKMKPSGRSN